MEINRQQKTRIFRKILIVALGLQILFAIIGVFNLNTLIKEYGLAIFWLTMLGIIISGRLIFGKEFGSSRTTLKGLKEIKVSGGHWICPACDAQNPDKFLATIDATMHCEKCGQLVVRESGSVNLKHVNPSLLHRTKISQRNSRIGLLVVWLSIIFLWILRYFIHK